MNIAFAKIGKSIKFCGKGFSPIGGDNEPSGCLMALANNNPDVTFYLVGKSNWKTLSSAEQVMTFPYGNVINVWDAYRKTGTDRDYSFIVDYFKKHNIVLDFGIMMMGQLGTVTIPGKIQKVSDEVMGTPAAVIDMTKGYTTPMTWWLNETKLPWVELVNDPRYTSNQSRDFFHKPKVSLGQYDYTYTANSIASYEDQRRSEVKVDSVYAGMETMFCVGRDLPEAEKGHRSTSLAIVLNEGNPSRYDMLNEWVLKDNPNVEVYGAWDEPKALQDSRFVGSRNIEEIQKIMKNVKYTFIIPIRDGWVTSKYIEMIYAGVIPFFHPSYDGQNHLDIPSIMRPKTPAELKSAIDILESNDALRVKLITGLQKKFCREEYKDGSFLSNKIMSSMIPNYKAPDLQNFEVLDTNSLESFF
jgi:hypothetical protein